MTNGTNLDAAPEHKKHEPHAHHAEVHESEKKHEAPAHHAAHHVAAASPPHPIETHWKVLAQQLHEKWPAITEDELKFIDKTKSALLAKVKERTGLESETAERQLDALITGLGN